MRGCATAGEQLGKSAGLTPCPEASLWEGLYSCLDSLIRLTGRSGLGTTFSGREGYELAFLTWWGSRMGPRPVWFVV